MLSEKMGDSAFYIVSIARIPYAAQRQDRKVEETVQPPQCERKDSNSKSPNAWLFQSNPVLYDLRGALRALKEQVWSVSRYAKEIGTGDRVYLWEAGLGGGIVGLAEISEPTRLQSEPQEQLPFAKVAEAFVGERVRTKLRILSVIEPVIARQTILSCQELATLGVLRCSRGTNFRLSREEVTMLDGLIQGAAA
jgi:hypothetical protein